MSWSRRIRTHPFLQSFPPFRYNRPWRLRSEPCVTSVIVSWTWGIVFHLEKRSSWSPIEPNRSWDVVEVGMDVGVLGAFGATGSCPLFKASIVRTGGTSGRTGPVRRTFTALRLRVRLRKHILPCFLKDRPRNRYKLRRRRNLPQFIN